MGLFYTSYLVLPVCHTCLLLNCRRILSLFFFLYGRQEDTPSMNCFTNIQLLVNHTPKARKIDFNLSKDNMTKIPWSILILHCSPCWCYPGSLISCNLNFEYPPQEDRKKCNLVISMLFLSIPFPIKRGT